MATNHELIIGNCMDMSEIPDGNVHLVVTSPPYFNAPFDYKKLSVKTMGVAKNIYAELKTNFDNERLDDGKVVLIIDDISKEIRSYLINMKIQSISKTEILKLVNQFDEAEDREKVLRIIYEEFSREYLSDIK